MYSRIVQVYNDLYGNDYNKLLLEIIVAISTDKYICREFWGMVKYDKRDI